MITRKVGLDWIEARLKYISKISTTSELEIMSMVLGLDLDFMLHDHALISLFEHDLLTRRAEAEIQLRKSRLGNVIQFPLPLMRALA